MDIAPTLDADPATQSGPFSPDERRPCDFATVESFIASGAFDAAVLRASKIGVEAAVARHKALELTGTAALG